MRGEYLPNHYGHPYQATIVPQATPTDPTASARVRYRWRAELVEADGRPSIQVEGYQAPDQAVGALVREAVEACETHDQVLDLIAGLFRSQPHFSAEATIGRAVRIANALPRRKHPGVKVVIHQPGPLGGDSTPKPVLATARRKRKGGAL